MSGFNFSTVLILLNTHNKMKNAIIMCISKIINSMTNLV